MSYMLSDKVDFKRGDVCVASIPIIAPGEVLATILGYGPECLWDIRLEDGTELTTQWFNLRPLTAIESAYGRLGPFTADEAIPFVEF